MNTNIKEVKKKKRSPALLTTILLLFLLIVILVTLAFFTSFDEVTNAFTGARIDIILTEPKWKPNDALNIVPDTTLDKDPYVTNNENIPTYVFLKVTVPAVKYKYDQSSGDDKGRMVYNGASTDKGFVPIYKFITVDDNGTPDNTSDDIIKMNDEFNPTQVINSTWQLVKFTSSETANPRFIDTAGNEAYEYVYYYYGSSAATTITALDPHTQTTKPLFDKVHLLNFRNDEATTNPYSINRDYSITVEAYGIQANYLSDGNGTLTTNDPEKIWKILNS